MNESFWDGHQLEIEAKQVLGKIIAAVVEFGPRAPPTGTRWNNEAIIRLVVRLRNLPVDPPSFLPTSAGRGMI